MIRELFIQPRATIDVAEISDFLAKNSRKNAVRFIEDFVELLEFLQRDPKLGFRLPLDTGVKTAEFWYIRFARFKNYLAIYRFDDTPKSCE